MTENEVLGRTVSQADNGGSPAEPPSRPPNRKALRTLALVVLLAIAGALVWANWATVSSIFHGGNVSDRIIGLSGRIEGDDSAVASKTSGRILEVRVREGDSVNAGQILAVLDDQQVRAREEQASGAVEGAVARTKAAKAQIEVLEEQLRQSQLQTEQATVDAEGRVSQAEADLAAAESDLARQEASIAARLVRQGFLYAPGAVGSCLPGRRQTTDRGYEGSVDNCKGQCRQQGFGKSRFCPRRPARGRLSLVV